MIFKLERASDYGDESQSREIEVNTIADLENIPERFNGGSICWHPPYELIINFEEKKITIYDDYLE